MLGELLLPTASKGGAPLAFSKGAPCLHPWANLLLMPSRLWTCLACACLCHRRKWVEMHQKKKQKCASPAFLATSRPIQPFLATSRPEKPVRSRKLPDGT